jgi:GMP synthase-like glutamine amidotransferase
MLEQILFIKHVAIEGPGTMGAFFENAGFQIKEVNLYASDELPQHVHGFAAIISLGGPMNVYEEEKYPFLKKEDELIKAALHENIPFLGICLGSQLLAKACGAKIVKSPQAEVGFFDVFLKPQAVQDAVFKNIHQSFKVFQWHEDMFEVAQNASWLAESVACPYQAFRAGNKAYGFQFHLEVDRAMMIAWMKEYWRVDDVLDCEKARNILSQYDATESQLRQVAEQIYKNFATIIKKNN